MNKFQLKLFVTLLIVVIINVSSSSAQFYCSTDDDCQGDEAEADCIDYYGADVYTGQHRTCTYEMQKGLTCECNVYGHDHDRDHDHDHDHDYDYYHHK